MTTPYISIKSVLYQLAITIDDRYWNEKVMLEQATRALRQLKVGNKLVQKVSLLEIVDHKAQLPSDLCYLTQVAYKTSDVTIVDEDLALPETSDLASKLTALYASYPWAAMRLSTNPYHDSICLDETIASCRDCQHEFSVDPSLVLTSTLCNGIILVSYLAYPTDDEGYALIPDDEILKEAILHYVLYRYWMSKYQMKEDGADSRMQFHHAQWSILSKKALSLNNPDVNQMENLKNIRNRLVHRSNRFDQLFLSLSNRENLKY